MTLLFHWIIAYCKTTKRIGTLNFTNMNLPFVVCLSIAGHTTQGYTGGHKHVCLLLGLNGLILVTSKRSGMLGQREYVTLGISMILCSTTDLVPTSVCLPFGASGFKFGSWVNVVTSADDKILCQIVVCLWRKAHMKSAYDFNLLMYFLALRIGYLSYLSWVYPLYSQRKDESHGNCIPHLVCQACVPLSPLCLPYSPFVSSSVS